MLQINGLEQGLEVFKCLGSDVRMGIVELLAKNGEMNLNEIAHSLGLTNGALTSHVRKLEECGIIQISSSHTKRGIQKLCSLKVDQMLLNVYPAEEERNMKVYETVIPIGHYSDYSAKGGCGLAGMERMIGAENDPRWFAYPERVGAQMLWLHDGFVEYRIPNLLPENQQIVQLTLSFEVASADQGAEADTQSMLHFLLNGAEIGRWRTLKSTDNARGIYTPAWWKSQERQYGFLKMLVFNQVGAFLDGVKLDLTGPDWNVLDSSGEMRLRFETHPEGGQEGGLALFGSGFGNYKQDIMARVHYMPKDMIYG